MQRPIRVLLVDDDPEFVDLAAEALERQCDAITTVTEPGAAAGLDRLADAEIDCIVSDYQMTGMDGLSFFEAVRDTESAIPFILFTDERREEIASKALSRGITDSLQKGTSTEQFANLANRIVDAVEQARADRGQQVAEAGFQALAESTELAVITIDAASIIDYVNEAVEPLLGYTADDLQGEPLATIIPDRFVDDHMAALERYLTTGERTLDLEWVEFPAVHKSGHEVPLGISYAEMNVDGAHYITAVVREISDRPDHVEALKRERDRFATLFDHFPEPTVAVTFEGDEAILRRVNPAFEETFGYESANAEGRPLDDLVVPADRMSGARDINAQAKRGEFVEREVRREAIDGKRDFIFRNIPISNDTEFDSFGVYVDITETKRERERYHAFLEQSSDIISVLGPDGTYQYISPSIEPILGYEPEALVGEDAFNYVHPDDREAVWEIFERAVSNPSETPTAEFRFRHADGSWRWVEAIGNNQLENPLIEGFIVNSRDITQRKRRERELERYERLVETVSDGVYMLDPEGQYTYVNSYIEEVTGYDRGELIGATPAMIMCDDDIDRLESGIRQILADEQETFTTEIEIHPADADPYPAGVKIAAMTSNGEFKGTVGIARDITERKERERELQRQNDRLDEFASLVSHDLRNPLNVVSGRVEMARKECECEHLDAAVDALERMEAIIEETLTLARQGQAVGETQRIRLDEMASDCWDRVATVDATLEVVDDIEIAGDPDRLQHVFENLFRNAVEHGGKTVTVRVGSLGDDGFYLEDNGPGITESERDAVFQRGYSTSGDDTGFGLAIVEEIIDAHGWEIEVTKSYSGGARFEITEVTIF